jgi:hypothetical protein
MFIEVLFIILKRGTSNPCIHWWMNQENVIYKYNGILHSALKRKKNLSHARTWINLKDIMLSQMIQSQILCESIYMKYQN